MDERLEHILTQLLRHRKISCAAKQIQDLYGAIDVVDPNNLLSLIHSLSPRERETLNHLMNDLQTKEIARKMDISPSTVKGYSTRLFSRFQVNSRKQLRHLLESAPTPVLADPSPATSTQTISPQIAAS